MYAAAVLGHGYKPGERDHLPRARRSRVREARRQDPRPRLIAMVEQLRGLHLRAPAAGPRRAERRAAALKRRHRRLQLASDRAAVAARPREKFDAAAFRRLDVAAAAGDAPVDPPAAARKTAHLAVPRDPGAGERPRQALPKHFKLTEKRYEELRAAAPEGGDGAARRRRSCARRPAPDAKELKGASAQMTRDGELVRVGAGKGCARTSCATSPPRSRTRTPTRRSPGSPASTCARSGRSAPKDFTWWAGAGAKRAKAALAAHDTEELDDGLLIRAEGPQGVREGQAAQGRCRPAAQVGLLPDGLRARRPRPLRPPRRGQPVLRLPRRRRAR